MQTQLQPMSVLKAGELLRGKKLTEKLKEIDGVVPLFVAIGGYNKHL